MAGIAKVVETFKKCENHVMTRAELSMVLKTLNPASFDEASVECLMSAKGLDVLHIEDFVTWLFEVVEAEPEPAAEPAQPVAEPVAEPVAGSAPEKAVGEAPQVQAAEGQGASCTPKPMRMVSDEERGRMIGEIFAFFDRDSDRYWNFMEANHWHLALQGVPLAEPRFKEMLQWAKMAPDPNDETKGLALETMVFFYLSGKFDILQHHEIFSSKVQMAQEVFNFFDQDEDGHWDSTESAQWKMVVGEAASVEDLIKATGGEDSKLSEKVVVDLYFHPNFADFQLNLEKHHETMRTFQVKLAEEVFTHFDKDKDGYWNYEEAVACQAALPAKVDASKEKFKWMVERLYVKGEDKSKGFSKRGVVHMYVEPSFQLNILKEHRALFS